VERLGRGADDVKTNQKFMSIKLRKYIQVGLVLAFFIGLMVLPFFGKSSNCGGNSYAMAACANFTMEAEMIAQEHNSHFAIDKMTGSDWGIFKMLAKDAWGVRSTDFMVKTNFFLGTGGSQQVVVVCLQQFANVPRPTIWNFYQKNSAHAVGYSDGTVGLISPTEFTNLNLNGFVSVASLATNSEFNTFK
jgi:hypothetical protein